MRTEGTGYRPEAAAYEERHRVLHQLHRKAAGMSLKVVPADSCPL